MKEVIVQALNDADFNKRSSGSPLLLMGILEDLGEFSQMDPFSYAVALSMLRANQEWKYMVTHPEESTLSDPELVNKQKAIVAKSTLFTEAAITHLIETVANESIVPYYDNN